MQTFISKARDFSKWHVRDKQSFPSYGAFGGVILIVSFAP